MNESRKKIGIVSFLLTVLYICFIVYFLFFADRLGRVHGYHSYRYNLVLFEEIRRFIIYRDQVSVGAVLLNLFGNLIVFVPLGFLIPLWTKKTPGLFTMALYSLLFSLLIETIQLFSRVGVFDVDDLFLNTVGGIIGWLLYQIGLRIYWRIKKKKGKEET